MEMVWFLIFIICSGDNSPSRGFSFVNLTENLEPNSSLYSISGFTFSLEHVLSVSHCRDGWFLGDVDDAPNCKITLNL